MKNLKGLHLWKVDLNKSTDTLNILTVKRDVAGASRKANDVCKKDATYFGNEIQSITYHGTIDA